CGSGVGARKNKYGSNVLLRTRPYADAVDATRQVGRHVKDKIRVPTAIVEIVLVEMHGGILIALRTSAKHPRARRRRAPRGLAGSPVRRAVCAGRDRKFFGWACPD